MGDDLIALTELLDECTGGDNEKAVKLLLVAAVEYMGKLDTMGVEIGFNSPLGRCTVNIEVEVEE